MKYIGRADFIVLFLLIMPTQNLFSQIILTPEVTGSVHYQRVVKEYFRPSWPTSFTVTETYYHVIADHIILGRSHQRFTGTTPSYWYRVKYSINGEQRGIVEFLARGDDENPLPADWMTQWNWTAMLKGFMVTETNQDAYVRIFEQDPQFSDGLLTAEDYNSSDMDRMIYHEETVLGVELDPIDITDQLRNSLFNEYPSDYIGAVLYLDFWTGITRLSNPHIEINYMDPSTPTPLPTHTPTPTQPTPTPEPGPDFRLNLSLNRTMFSPGDPFQLVVTVEKPDGNAYYRQPLFVLLDVYGEYYFYPSWNPWFDYKLVDITTFIESIPILNFEWPNGSGSANGIAFHAAILNTALTSIAGNTDTVVFGWTDGY